MDRNEIIAAINAKIAGQGNQIDLGGALADILLDLAGASIPIEVTDITALTGDQLDALHVGDKVVKKTGTQKHLYFVNYKDETTGELLLTYADWQNVEGVYYEKGESGWAYVQTDNTHISA